MDTSTIVIIAILVLVFVIVAIVALAIVCFGANSGRRATPAEVEAGTTIRRSTETVFYVTAAAPSTVLTLDVAALRDKAHRQNPTAMAAGVPALIATAATGELLARHGPDTVLAFYDGVSKAFVEVNLEQLLSDGEAMSLTASVPLVAVQGDDASGAIALTASLKKSASRARRVSESPSSVVIVEDDTQGTLQGAKLEPPAAYPAALAGREAVDPAHRRLPLVTPRIYPKDTVISNTRLVHVSANRYVDVKSKHLAVLDPEVVQALDDQCLRHMKRRPLEPKKIVIAKATLRVRADDDAVGALPRGHGLLVIDVYPSGQDGAEAITVAAVPARVRVCWTSNAVWHEYEPLTLPPGRWCIRAESVNQPGEHHLEPKSSSRVFTVQHEHVL